MNLREPIIYTIVWLLAMPLLTLTHELGHAIVPLLLSKEKVEIVLGNYKYNIKINLGKLVIHFHGYASYFALGFGYIICKAKGKYINLLMNLGGPIISLTITTTLYIVLSQNYQSIKSIEFEILNALLNYSLFQFVLTIIPIKYNYYPYKGFTSDGYKIISLLKRGNKCENKSYYR